MSAASPALPAQPYPGLRPFGDEDRGVFFGREAQTVSVLSLLAERQFIAVVGSSGSGKSSLVRAGVIPAVREGFLLGTDWKIVIIKPGNDPYGNLARGLLEANVVHTAPSAPLTNGASEASLHLAETLQYADSSLTTLVAEARESSGTPVLIVVDQFEELFTFRRAPAESTTAAARFASRDQAAGFVKLLCDLRAIPKRASW